MIRRSWLVALALGGAAGGCWYDSFLQVSGAGSDGSGGVNGTGGEPSLGGAAGLGGQAGSGSGGEDPSGSFVVTDDAYEIDQGATLDLPAGALFENDEGTDLHVVARDDEDPERPSAYDATYVVGNDGSFYFEPHPDFWGTYAITYTAEDASGEQASAVIRVRVRPVDVSLAAVAAGLNGFVIDGVAGDALGTALARAGDFDGDDRADLLVGAPGTSGSAGRAIVVYGRAARTPISLEDTSEEFLVLGGGASDAAGSAVSTAGDLDDDGFDDVIVGAPGDLGAPGKAYVVFGRAARTSVDLGTLGAADGYALTGVIADRAGRVVGGGHDVNGDGIPDLLVSTDDFDGDPSSSYWGTLHVIFGPGSGGAIAGASSLEIRGSSLNERLPQAAVTVGDIDGDGRSEVFLSSSNGDALLKGATGAVMDSWPLGVGMVSEDGSTYGWRRGRGGAPDYVSVSAAGDVNGDGVLDVAYCDGNQTCRVVLGVPSSLTSGWQITGFPVSSEPRVAGGGDLNGDGRSDLAFVVESKGYVLFGRTTATGTTNVTSLTSSQGFALSPEAGGALSAVAQIGDVNGDGIDDFAVSDASHGSGAGRVYVVFGKR